MLRPVVALLASSLLLASTSTRPAAGRIVFGASGASPGRTAIYTVNADGSDPRQLTKNRADHSPTWSPNGRSIIYVDGAVGRNGALVRMTARGTDREVLVREPATSQSPIDDPTWSPDSRRLAFTSSRLATPQVWIFSFSGNPRPVTREFGVHPTWAPDSRRLAYAGQNGIFVVRSDGRRQRLILGTSARDGAPVWSPNGRWIALRTLNANGTNSLDVITPLGKRRRILARAALIVPEAWSPTSSAVLFLRSDSTTSASPPGLYIVSLRGGRPRPVMNTDGATIGAAWHR